MLDLLPIPLIISAVATLLFALLAVTQTLRQQTRAGCFSTILVAIALFSALAFVVQLALNDESLDNIAQITLITIVGTLLATGILLWFLEKRDSEAEQLYSRGLLSLGTSLILVTAFFLVPQIPQRIIPIPTATSIAEIVRQQDEGQPAGQSNIVPTEVAIQVTSTPISTLAPTMTYTPLPSPSPTRTRRAYVPPTQTPTPAEIVVQEQCGATVTVNLNMREQDNAESEIVDIIPSGDYVPLVAKNMESTWWQAEFQGQTGWVSAEYLQLDPVCSVELN